MLRPSMRTLAGVMLAAFLPGCKGDDPVAPAPPTPTASIALGAATATVVAGATTPVAVTLTRGGGYTGAVSVTAASLPAGVTASTETIAAGATSATVTLTAASTAAATTAAAVSVTGTGTGTGSGVTIASQALALTVSPAAGASIALSAAAGSVQAGSNGTVTVTLTRAGGFTGDVVIAAPSLPTGVTAASQTITGTATSATLTFVTATNAGVATTALSITGTGTGVTIAPQAYALTITAAPTIAQIGTDITNVDLNFGASIALSADGTRMIVSAKSTANGTTRVYQRSGTAWTQLGADIIGEAAGDQAGVGVDINAAGTRIAIGSWLNSGGGASNGHVRVYDLLGSTWTQVGADIDGAILNGSLGWRVALSASGNRLVAAGPNRFNNNGQAAVFDLIGTTWTQVGATLTGGFAFGTSVDISSDGTTIAVGLPSAAGTIRAGSVQVFRLVGSTWTQLGNELTDPQNANTQSEGFGFAVSLTANGSRIAVAAPQNKESAPAGSGRSAGQVKLFDLVGSTWTQVGNSVNGTADVGRNGDALGETLMLSDDGTRFAATIANNSEAKVYTLTSGAWVQTGATIVAPAGVAQRSEGLALSPDGKTVAVGYINGSPRRVRVFSITP